MRSTNEVNPIHTWSRMLWINEIYHFSKNLNIRTMQVSTQSTLKKYTKVFKSSLKMKINLNIGINTYLYCNIRLTF